MAKVKVPSRPKIYHITHLGNLPQIVSDGRIWSDAMRIKRGLTCVIVGMSEIKKRRLEDLEVHCHAGTMVGQYVPFYFCPRSIMLYILYQSNHPDLSYRGGQRPIVHLQADLHATVRLADKCRQRWAFSDTNAGAHYANFYDSLASLGEVDWAAVEKTDFRSPAVKDGKQAEFLVFESFPWSLVEKIGVADPRALQQAQTVLDDANHHPPASVERGWYFRGEGR